MFEGAHIGFIGGGNMGEALIRGLTGASLFTPDRVHVYDVSKARVDYLVETYQVRPETETSKLAQNCAFIVLAVKPQTMHAVLENLHMHVFHHPLIISIAAGISLSTLSDGLPSGTPLIRVMPNTPALVLQGASALARGSSATNEHMEQALALFRAVGTAMEVEEKLMDTVTGLSGSGPAYVLLLIESLIDAGVLMGLSRPAAKELVLQTMAGTVQMVRETGKHPAELKDMITSPAGTTIQGLKVMEERSVRGALMEAVAAATKRSKELGKS
ncbi:MAG: pyrroline-5-carboxylate reductase [Acidobacteriota bacterium]